jgi:hypothetical protein
LINCSFVSVDDVGFDLASWIQPYLLDEKEECVGSQLINIPMTSSIGCCPYIVIRKIVPTMEMVSRRLMEFHTNAQKKDIEVSSFIIQETPYISNHRLSRRLTRTSML